MYKFQPQALTDRELIKYGGLWLDEESLPVEAQRELLRRLENRCDELEDALEHIKKLQFDLNATDN
jgi:hypothetical protein